MKLVLSVALLYFLTSCANNDDNRKEVIIAPSKPKVADTIVATEQDKAIGDIKFGISEKEFEKVRKDFDKKTETPAWEGSTAITHKIGQYEYTYMDGEFYHDSLYKIVLRGDVVQYDDYNNEMPNKYKSIRYLLTLKYGNPTTENGLPSWTSIAKNRYEICCAWEIGKRTVELKVASRGTYFTLDMFSYLSEIDLNVFLEENNKKLKESEKGAKALLSTP
jgi:hypothetical protein